MSTMTRIQRKTTAALAFLYILFTHGLGTATVVPARAVGKSILMEVRLPVSTSPDNRGRESMRKELLLDYTIVRTSNRHVPQGLQYAVRFKLPSGEVLLHRLRGMYPTSRGHRIGDETQEFRLECNKLALDMYRQLIERGDTVAPKLARGLTCASGMQQYCTWHGENRRSSQRNFNYAAQYFIAYFGARPLALLDRKDAEEFVEMLAARCPRLSFNTVRLAVQAASSMIEHYRDKGMWNKPNPFARVLKKYAAAFPASNPGTARFSESEWAAMSNILQNSNFQQANIFIEVASATGLRPSEVLRLDTGNIDHDELTWTFTVTKKPGMPVDRTIAIPQGLVAFIDGQGIEGKLPLTQSTLRRQLKKLSQDTGVRITQKIFRKDFAHRMEQHAGAPWNLIDLHQGRGQHGVLHRHYLVSQDRPAKLCRPYIEKTYRRRHSLNAKAAQGSKCGTAAKTTEVHHMEETKSDVHIVPDNSKDDGDSDSKGTHATPPEKPKDNLAASAKTLKDKAQYFIKEHGPIHYVKSLGWVIYKKGVYTPVDSLDIEELAEQVSEATASDPGNITSRDRKNLMDKVRAQIGVKAKLDDFNADPDRIVMANCVFNLRTGKKEQFSPKLRSTMKLSYDYNPNAECPRFKQFLQEIQPYDAVAQRLFVEFMGYCLIPDTSYRKILMFVGDGSNGKSVYLNTLEYLVGTDYTSNLSIKDLNNKHRIHELFGKRVNTGSENEDVLIKNTALLKRIAGDEEGVYMELKYRNIEKFIPRCKLVFASNRNLRFNDSSDGLRERLVVVKFTQKFDAKTANLGLKEELHNELPGIFNLAIKGLSDLRARGHFEISDSMKAAAEDIHNQANPMKEFIDLYYDIKPNSRVFRGDVFKNFEEYRKRFGYSAVHGNEFWNEVKRVVPGLQLLDKQGRNNGMRDRYVMGIKPKA